MGGVADLLPLVQIAGPPPRESLLLDSVAARSSGRLDGGEGPVTSDVMEGVEQEVMVGNRFQLGRRADPATGRRCVSVCDPKLARKGRLC